MNDDAKIFQIKLGHQARSPVNTKTCELNVKSNMIRWSFFLIFAAIPCFCFSQVGVNIRYLSGKSEILEAQNISQNGIHGSIEYHLRLKSKRIEFRPGIGYRTTNIGNSYDGHFNSLDFDLGTAIYPFDFAGDCDCPTFSKEGGLIKKGFFLEVIPGVGYQIFSRLRSEPNDPSKLPIRSKNINWKIGGAAGLDIGISDHFTLTPMFSATMLSASEWDGLWQDGTAATLDDYVYLGAGIRVTYNAEDKKRRRRN